MAPPWLCGICRIATGYRAPGHKVQPCPARPGGAAPAAPYGAIVPVISGRAIFRIFQNILRSGDRLDFDRRGVATRPRSTSPAGKEMHEQ
jgi:hypothetical protein